MDDAADEREATPRRRRTGLAIAGGSVAVLALALGIAWHQREPIARNLIGRQLAASGVPGSYRIARLSPGTQVLEDLRIGDPARPDLTARRAVVHIGYPLGLPRVTGIEAEGVRLNAAIRDGRITLGAVDRLLPKPSGAPFALPDLNVVLSDAAMRLETPAGVVALAVAGQGNLVSGFAGRYRLASGAIEAAGCRVEAIAGSGRVTTRAGEPRLAGLVKARAIACAAGQVAAPRAVVDVTLAKALDGWRGSARLATRAIRTVAATVAAGDGRITFAGDNRRSSGRFALGLDGARAKGARAARLSLEGDGTIERGRATATASLRAHGAAVPTGAVRALAAAGGGTPAGPALRQAAVALAAAGERFVADAALTLESGGGHGTIGVRRIEARSATGARLRAGPGGAGQLVAYDWPAGRLRLAASARIDGGGLPGMALDVAGDPAARLTGSARIGALAAGGSRVELAPVQLAAEGGTLRFRTAVALSGPLGDGSVERLALPIEGIRDRRGLRINAACVPLTFDRLAIAGTQFGRSALRLCPTGAAMIVPGGGGAFVPGLRLRGRVGTQPLTMESRRVSVALGRPGFAAEALAIRLGEGGDPTRLDVVRLDGQFTSAGIGGRFTGAGGKIGKVPLILSDAAGPWTLAGGVLSLSGGLAVADEADPARFQPLAARDVSLVLRDSVIRAGGTLHEPKSDRAVADVAIVHDLRSGTGDARLAVKSLTFDDALQPEALTRLTLGVVANVAGTVTGEGRIRWNAAGVTSDGDFATERLDLAAAFGPVRGIATRIHFSDLLGLETPPGQVATVAEINPGIAVTGGIVGYQLLAGQKVRVEGARWPFSGGELALDPTVLDFGQPVERRMTFRVTGMDAAQFIQQFDIKNISVTGTFDGTLPMVFDERGGRIDNGRLVVRKGGGTLAYVGEVSNASLGMFGRLAFDALKSMRYDSLAIELDGRLDGELISRVLFDGTNETPKEAKRGGLLGQLTGLPFRFRITIRAPFRGLLNSASSLNDPRGLIRQALPPKVDLPGSIPPVQPGVSKDQR